jgi:hypothetical protein
MNKATSLSATLLLGFGLCWSAACGSDEEPRAEDASPAPGQDSGNASAVSDPGASPVEDLPTVLDDGVETATDPGPPDATSKDESAEPDAVGPAPRCSAPPETPPSPVGPLAPPMSVHRGIDHLEREAYERLREVVLADEGVFFVTTYNVEEDSFIVDSGPETERQTLVFKRVVEEAGGVSYEVVEGEVSAIFPSVDPHRYSSHSEILEAFENPNGVSMADSGYTENDPRVGFLPPESQSYPFPLLRISAFFDAPDAPDAVVSLKPWATWATGTHGGMSMLQSQSTLFLSGAGAREGVVLEESALLADVVPTALAALGAGTTGGMGPDGRYEDGLYLLRQDGRVLWESLADDPCERARHVVIVLFDGVQAFELLHQLLDDDAEVDLPVMRELARSGAVYRHGAVTNFPSVSAPGHMTAGTGLWSGHHGFLANAFYRREDQQPVNPFSLISDIADTMANPQKAFDVYERGVAPGIETLAQAAHRALGAYDPETGEGAFVAVFNEIAIGGADFTTIDYLNASDSMPEGNSSIARYRLADDVGVAQVDALLGNETNPVPTVLQLSFVSSDAAGEMSGPNSDLLREVLTEMDARVGRVRAAYERRGALDDTLFIIVSDHGMELQDPSREAGDRKAVAKAGIKAVQPFAGIFYLRTLEIEAAAGPGEGDLTVLVRNHDNDAPIMGASVACAAGCAGEPPATDVNGAAVLKLDGEPAELELSATHPSFNVGRLKVDLSAL